MAIVLSSRPCSPSADSFPGTSLIASAPSRCSSTSAARLACCKRGYTCGTVCHCLGDGSQRRCWRAGQCVRDCVCVVFPRDSSYDSVGDGNLREYDLENYVFELIPTLPNLRQLKVCRVCSLRMLVRVHVPSSLSRWCCCGCVLRAGQLHPLLRLHRCPKVPRVSGPKEDR